MAVPTVALISQSGTLSRQDLEAYVAPCQDQPGAAGYHDDSSGTPAAYIDTGQNPQFTGSHEPAEMLVDPTGDKFYAAPSPDPADNGTPFTWIANEVSSHGSHTSSRICTCLPLSDFITPNYGNGTTRPYDVADGLTAPRGVGINGYISRIDEQQGVWKQATNFTGQGFQVRVLGPANQPQTEGKSPREWVDAQTYEHLDVLGIRLFD